MYDYTMIDWPQENGVPNEILHLSKSSEEMTQSVPLSNDSECIIDNESNTE